MMLIEQILINLKTKNMSMVNQDSLTGILAAEILTRRTQVMRRFEISDFKRI